MMGFDPLSLSAAYLLASATVCQPQAPVQVEMSFTNNPPIERDDKPSHDLNSFHIDTTFSHSRNEVFTVGGLTMSEFSPAFLVEFDAFVNPANNDGCISVKSVKITLNYAPTIYIASEFKPGSCRYNVTLQHEARHVNTDIITFNEFLPQIRQAVQDAVDRLTTVGPVPRDQFIPERDKLLDKIKQALAAKVDALEVTRMQRQQMIDTRQEYMRTTNMCQDEPLPQP